MKPLSSVLIKLGLIMTLCSALLLILIFYPTAKVELQYQLRSASPDKAETKLDPLDRDFGIVIPKIYANSSIVANVDPYNAGIYQKALTQGVAHALGTSFPGQVGNIFLFSHSSVNFYEAQNYNSVFYLLNKLEMDDKIELYYKGEKFVYKVSNKQIVNPNQIQYLTKLSSDKTLTLMTCWPAGTSLQRLIVQANIASQ